MTTHADEIRRASEAAHVIEHPLFVDAWESVRGNIINALETDMPRTPEQNAHLILSLQVLRLVRSQIEQHIMTGKIEAERKEDT